MVVYERIAGLQVDKRLYNFLEEEVIAKHPKVQSEEFWLGLAKLFAEFGLENRKLLEKRDAFQIKLDNWNKEHFGQKFDIEEYQKFLEKIEYKVADPEDFVIKTQNIDSEITSQFGPQLVVPIGNARYALNAANARWGSLYDALYGTDAISQKGELALGKAYNIKRGEAVIAFAKKFLDEVLELIQGSHSDVIEYSIEGEKLQVKLKDGTLTQLKNPELLIGFNGDKSAPSSLLFKHNGLHIDVQIDSNSIIGKLDSAGIKDVILESAVTTIMDCEDSTTAVDGEDKTLLYSNWLGLMNGTLTEKMNKGEKTFIRSLNPDRTYSQLNSSGEIRLKGRALLFIRNVGHLMKTPAILDADGDQVFEGILDGVVTGLIAPFDFNKSEHKNSEKNSVYIVKPKMHGPEEVNFANRLFGAIEDLTKLPRNTLKIGVMDEERRTSINLRACIKEVDERIVFINTGFLDRTGDEIHTSMYAGVMVRKDEMKRQKWFSAYETSNVKAGIVTGFVGKAQIGKGMWAAPDLMATMLKDKISHPKAGATTAWVPSATAATLHALHYHKVDVAIIQKELQQKTYPDYLKDILTIPFTQDINWTADEVQSELDNNCQGILGYVVRWVEQGIGCSKVPDIHDIALMEDRATLRISSQHIVNWLLHGIVSEEQVKETLKRMAVVVDKQNEGDPNYLPIVDRFDTSCAFMAASDLIFKGLEQPSGYTEPLLHKWRLVFKSQQS